MTYISISPETSPKTDQGWTYLTNHSHVMVCIWRNPLLTTREIANLVGITERSVQRIIRELSDEGVVTATKDGRNNRYTVDASRKLRHPLENHRTVADLLHLVGSKDEVQPE